MAQKNFRTGSSSIDASAQVHFHTLPPDLEHPPGGLFPIRLSAWNSDEYRLANGWPVEIPSCDIRARVLVSAAGEVLADRVDPGDLSTSANARWIADDELYDTLELTWRPIQGDVPLVIYAGADTAPRFIADYEYKIGSEIFYTNALNFDVNSAQQMSLDTGPALAGAGSYSVIMVGSFNSVYGNSLDLPYSGIWCPADTNSGWMSVTLQGSSLYLETDQTPRKQIMRLAHLVSISQPMMLAMVFDRPYATFYVGTGPSSITSQKISSGSVPNSFTPGVLIGATAADNLHTADMALMDLNLYANALTAAEVHTEFATLSAAYGGDR